MKSILKKKMFNKKLNSFFIFCMKLLIILNIQTVNAENMLSSKVAPKARVPTSKASSSKTVACKSHCKEQLENKSLKWHIVTINHSWILSSMNIATTRQEIIDEIERQVGIEKEDISVSNDENTIIIPSYASPLMIIVNGDFILEEKIELLIKGPLFISAVRIILKPESRIKVDGDIFIEAVSYGGGGILDSSGSDGINGLSGDNIELMYQKILSSKNTEQSEIERMPVLIDPLNPNNIINDESTLLNTNTPDAPYNLLNNYLKNTSKKSVAIEKLDLTKPNIAFTADVINEDFLYDKINFRKGKKGALGKASECGAFKDLCSTAGGDGENGRKGFRGENGYSGKNAGNITMYLQTLEAGSYINAKGGNGGNGGDGGTGHDGGVGGDGGAGSACEHAQVGGNGGRSGDGGDSGDGGSAGNGGIITISLKEDKTRASKKFDVSSGKNGLAGNAGKPGKAGEAGKSGDEVCVACFSKCERKEAPKNGSDGNIGLVGKIGKNASDGSVIFNY